MESKKLNSVYNHPDITSVCEYIKEKFYFAILLPGIHEPASNSSILFFNIDDELIYNNFYNDFGPLNLGCLYKYCWKVNKLLNNIVNRHKQIVHYCTQDEKKKANAAYLVAAYTVLYLKKSTKDAHKPLIEKKNYLLRPFQDASIGISHYNIRLTDCLNALQKAASLGFFDFADFNLSEYIKYEKIQYGDLTWIVPQKFIAFISPSTEPESACHPPEHYYKYFMENNVNAVVRLNSTETYDSNRFTKIGLKHYDMFIPDGSIPPRHILNEFLHIAETINGPIAVHCQAGLGRTGSLISAYLIKHYKMTAREAIAWIRICRPGSVIGHQQGWLESMQKELWYAGQKYRMKNYGHIGIMIHHKHGIYSSIEKFEKNCSIVSSKNNLVLKKKKKKNEFINKF